jgi:GNAT superfamily N-acetyltransferase
VARAETEMCAVLELINSRYAWRGYRVPREEPAPSELTLVATQYGSAVGTLTLRFDGPARLRADESYREEIDAARSAGRCVCELGRFAVAPDAQSKAVIAALFGRVRAIVRGRREVTDVFVEVNPRHVAFYRRGFGFEVAAEGRLCPRVLAPSVLLRLEVAAFERRMRERNERASAWTRQVLRSAPAGSPRGISPGSLPTPA